MRDLPRCSYDGHVLVSLEAGTDQLQRCHTANQSEILHLCEYRRFTNITELVAGGSGVY